MRVRATPGGKGSVFLTLDNGSIGKSDFTS